MIFHLALTALLTRTPSALSLARPSAGCCTIVIKVQVPEGTGPVYLAGSAPSLGPWKPDGMALTGTGAERSAQISGDSGTILEYKFTLGSWDREAVASNGVAPGNYRLVLERDTVVTHRIAGFKRSAAEYLDDWKGGGVLGRVVVWKDVRSAFLGPTRHVEIWLPPGYDATSTARYPVLYMHDGQNLFDPRLSYGGVDWGVDETIVKLVAAKAIPPIIVVAVWNSAERFKEYSPWQGGPDYARFLIEELIPRVNREFRTRTGPGNTMVGGSSMGGLLSFYLVSHHPEIFGACACMSSHFPLSEAVLARNLPGFKASSPPDTVPYITRDIEAGLTVPHGTRYWFDYGTMGLDSEYGPTHEMVRGWLLEQGLVEGRDFVVRRYDGANHNEASWRARLEDPVKFLFGEKRQ